MPKAKAKDDLLTLDFGKDEDEGSEANPIDPATGGTTFDDLSPRFVRQLDEAVDKVRGKKAAKPQDDDDLDPSDEEEDEDDRAREEEDEDEEEDESNQRDEEEEADPGDEDEDEPRPGRKVGNVKFEKRLARADRLLEESRTQIAELQDRDRAREARDKVAASESDFNSFKRTSDVKLSSLKALKIKAIDDGDTAAQVDLDEQITDIKAEINTKKQAHETAKASLEESTKRRGASRITLTKVAQWTRKNPRFNADPEFAEVVRGIDRALVGQGSNPEDDEHYEEIDKRVRKLYPELTPRRKTPPRKHPSSQVSREGSPSQRRPSGDAKVTVNGDKIKISPAKLARVKENMARFGLDPSDKKDLKEYILNNPGL